MARYSYSDSLKIMLIPYVILGILWYPLSEILSIYIQDSILSQFVLDVLATIFVFFVSLVYDNTSVYDPYWHITPMFFVGYWSFKYSNFWMPFLTFFYCNKQNFNYFRFWPGMQYEDYRYQQIQKKFPNPFVFWIISLLGLQMMPTILVFLAYIPTQVIMADSANANPVIYYLGVFITFTAILIETVADHQLYPYRIKAKKGNCEEGLWKYSRHPNYFGECLFWWGLFITSLSVSSQLLLAVGAIGITALFLGFSIPNMEEHLMESRKSYKDYQKRVCKFVPFIY